MDYTPLTTEYPEDYRSGMVALVGKTNVGKSTLLNRVLKEKVSIVSPIVQTTRNMIRGIWSDERGQLVFLDTPGIHKARYDLGRVMNKTARASLEGTDVALLVVDATRTPSEEDEGWIRRLVPSDIQAVVALNKIERGRKHADEYQALWKEICQEKEIDKAVHWHEISARNGQGVDDLVEALYSLCPNGPPLFPEDLVSDFPRKLAIADIVRERFFYHLQQELPHAIAVHVENLEEDEDKMRIEADVYVNKHSQKGIVIGNKGRILKKVTREAEEELEKIYEKKARLKLWVKVQKDWIRNYWLLKKLGYCRVMLVGCATGRVCRLCGK